jgi:hypothetical protein
VKQRIVRWIKKHRTLYDVSKIIYAYVSFPEFWAFRKIHKNLFRRIIENHIIKNQFKNNERFSSSKIIFPKRRIPHVLILCYYYRPGSIEQTEREFSTEKYNLINSLHNSQLASVDIFYYDQDYQPKVFPDGDLDLVIKCLEESPNLIILSSYGFNNLGQPRLETLKYIGNKLGVPIIPIWYDSVSEKYYKRSIVPLDSFTFKNLFIDSNSIPERKNDIELWTPQDSSIFNDPSLERNILVSFVGSTSSYRSVRLAYLNEVKENGIDLLITGGTENSRLTMNEYANIFKKSQISINFSFSVGDTHQLKGRVFEVILCGALLFESENREIEKYFVPYEDYVPFSGKTDLVTKLRYYIEHPLDSRRIANSGKEKALKLYNETIFWKKVLGTLGERSKEC